MQLEDFDTLEIEGIEDAGFRILTSGNLPVFVPCYNQQNGYYSSDLELIYKGETTEKMNISRYVEDDIN